MVRRRGNAPEKIIHISEFQRDNMKHLFKTSDGDLRWGWRAVILIVGTILFGIILNVILMTALTVGYSSQGLAREQAMEKATLASTDFIVQVVLSVLQLGFLLWILRWLVVKVEKQPFDLSKLGLVSTNRSKHILFGITLAVTLSLLTIGIGFFTSSLEYLGDGFDLFGAAQVLITMFLAVVLAPASGFGEEIAFRGYLQTRIAQRYDSSVAVVIVAVLFALSHPVSSSNPLLYLGTATLVGILFGTIFLRTGSLWTGIALHTVWDYIQIAVLAVRNSADERFFGSPFFVFDNVSGTTQMLIEFGVILLALIFILLVTKSSVRVSEKVQHEQVVS
jgi:membrane protease YdiL (CAAX protease family)